jgi:hypothetical protein
MKRRDFLKTTWAFSATFLPFNIYGRTEKIQEDTNGIARECLMEDNVPQGRYMVYERDERAILGRIDPTTQKEFIRDVNEDSNSEYFYTEGKYGKAVRIPSGEIVIKSEEDIPPKPQGESYYSHLSPLPEYGRAKFKRNAIEDKLFIKMLQKIQPKLMTQNPSEFSAKHVIAHPNSNMKWERIKPFFSSYVQENEYILLPSPEYVGVVATQTDLFYLKEQGGIFVEQGGMAILNPDNVRRVIVV